LTKDLAIVNKPAKKALQKKSVSTTTNTKKAALIMPIQWNVSAQSRAGASKLVKGAVVAEIKGVVIIGVRAGKTSTRTIKLSQRFR